MKKFITNNIRINVVWYIVWLIAGIFILFWRLGDLIGLHSDEAVFGIYSEMILEGARPLWGIFNIYTAPIHAYMLAEQTQGMLPGLSGRVNKASSPYYIL